MAFLRHRKADSNWPERSAQAPACGRGASPDSFVVLFELPH